MALYPESGDVVLYCHRGELRIVDRAAWDREGAGAPALGTLKPSESGVLGWFLRYWLGEAALRPPYQARGEVKADFDL